MRTLCVILLIISVAPVSYSFDLPDKDPWYFQSNEAGYTFLIPDKSQHYWGSALLNEFGKKLPLPHKNVTSPTLAFAAGFIYEVWQEMNGIGFSPRDLAADALGILSSQLNTDTFVMWMDYCNSERTIMINFSRRL